MNTSSFGVHLVGCLEVRSPDPTSATRADRPDAVAVRPWSVSGRLTQTAHDLPWVGWSVELVALRPQDLAQPTAGASGALLAHPATRAERREPVGRVTTGPDGQFWWSPDEALQSGEAGRDTVLTAAPQPDVMPAVMPEDTSVSLWLIVRPPERETPAAPLTYGPYAWTAAGLTLSLQWDAPTADAPPPALDALWETLADVATADGDVNAGDPDRGARVLRFQDLVRALQRSANPSSGSARWSDAQRRQALDTLELAFLDPHQVLRQHSPRLPTLAQLQTPDTLAAFSNTLAPAAARDPAVQQALSELQGKVRTFQRLDDVDWSVDRLQVRQGKVNDAVLKFQDQYKFPHDSFDTWAPLRPFDQDLVDYRNYLRDIWERVGQIYEPFQNQTLTAQQARQQLETRFHQNFSQNDTRSKPANELCIQILSDILQAPVGTTWGLGISPLPARGPLSARAYLDLLIQTSGLSGPELERRYRLDLHRDDNATSSRVQENIATLQAFFRDGFQATPDPQHTAPDIVNAPIVPPPLQGRAPFFLWYDEWLRQQEKFYPENHFDYRRSLIATFSEQDLTTLQSYVDTTSVQNGKDDWAVILAVAQASAALKQGHTHYYQGEYTLATVQYQSAYGTLRNLFNSSKALKTLDLAAALAERKAYKVNTFKDLEGPPEPYESTFIAPFPWIVYGVSYSTREATRKRCALRVYYYLLYVLPLCLADVAYAQGDYITATFWYGQVTRVPIGVAFENNDGGYRPHYLADTWLYHRGSRPYTVNTSSNASQNYPLMNNDGTYYDTHTLTPLEDLAIQLLPKSLHRLELKNAQLRHANALLDWADALYRTDEPASIQRARELYKAVLVLHGTTPPISPQWPSNNGMISGSFQGTTFFTHQENPAVRSQKNRAYAGFYKIEQHLNWYGEDDNTVPALRYRVLKDVADRFAALAKATQQDLLHYTDQLETAWVDRLQLTNLIQKSTLNIKVTDEQKALAQFGVSQAQAQYDAIEADIAARRKALEESKDFFNQLTTFLGGMVKAFTGLPGAATSFMGSGLSSSAGLSSSSGAAAGTGALAAGMGVMAGYAAFVYAGYTSMSAMVDQYNSQAAQIKQLEEKALPAAQAQINARKREVTIAQYHTQMALADLALARDLLTFQEQRFLNLDFWVEMSRLMQRLLRRYLEMAARAAWLAERALAYELNRSIDLVRFDYDPRRLKGISGADLLQADLAELEALRVEHTARTLPIRYTVSMASVHPLALGQLKQTGRCAFATQSATLQAVHPGTHSHRLLAVRVEVIHTGVLDTPRGMLLNEGISFIPAASLNASRALIRAPEGLPISQPGPVLSTLAVNADTLQAFEGIGFDTFWRLELPLHANAASLSAVADVLVTFELQSQFDPALYQQHIAQPPQPVRRWVLLSAQRFADTALGQLQQGQTATLRFDLRELDRNPLEKNRTVTNIALALVHPQPLALTVQVHPEQSNLTVNALTQDGLAWSTNPSSTPGVPAPPPEALNACIGLPADQAWALTLNPSASPGVDFGKLTDVFLAVEVEAGWS